MPLEIMIDTKRKRSYEVVYLRRMDELEEAIDEIPELSKPISIVNLVKYSKQAYYNGKPEYYDLPTSQEQSFILSVPRKKCGQKQDNVMKSYVDSTGQFARITTFMRDESGDKLPKLKLKSKKLLKFSQKTSTK
jgi:predicted RND superfamily exporter protein